MPTTVISAVSVTTRLDPLRGSSVFNQFGVAFYNQRGTAEQHIKEGKNAINWTRLTRWSSDPFQRRRRR